MANQAMPLTSEWSEVPSSKFISRLCKFRLKRFIVKELSEDSVVPISNNYYRNKIIRNLLQRKVKANRVNLGQNFATLIFFRCVVYPYLK